MVASKNQARLIILATFVLGVLAGVLAMNLFDDRKAAAKKGTRLMDELTKEVKLEHSKRTKVEQILNETRQKYQELQKQVRPQFNEIRLTTRARIRNLLTPEQQARYDEWNR